MFWLSCHLDRCVRDINDFWPLMLTAHSSADRQVNDFLVYLHNKTGEIYQSHYCCFIVMLSAPVSQMADSLTHRHWSTGATAFIAFHLLRCDKMAKQMGKQHFKLTNKWMGCDESLLPHKLFKSLAAAAHMALHQFDGRSWREWKTAIFFPDLVFEAPGVLLRIYCAHSIKHMWRHFPLFDITPSLW